MTLPYVLLGLIILLVLVLVAVRIGMSKERTVDEAPRPVIHASGVYSVVRRNPREPVLQVKPTEGEIRQYLAGKNEDIEGNALSENDKERLVREFFEGLEANIAEVAKGDLEEVEFYYYDFERHDPVCRKFVAKGHFVAREDIYKYSVLVPPFHLGCACVLRAQRVTEKLRNTTLMAMRPLLTDENPVPKLPNWHTILKPRSEG